MDIRNKLVDLYNEIESKREFFIDEEKAAKYGLVSLFGIAVPNDRNHKVLIRLQNEYNKRLVY